MLLNFSNSYHISFCFLPSRSFIKMTLRMNSVLNWMLFSYQLLFPLSFLVLAVEKDEFNFHLIKHQPCAYTPGKSKWERVLEFEGGTEQMGPKLIQKPGEPNCYTIGEKVTVFSEFKGEFSIYLELRGSTSKKQVPESCSNRREGQLGNYLQ